MSASATALEMHESARAPKCTPLYVTITARTIVDLLDIVSTRFLVQFAIMRLLDTIRRMTQARRSRCGTFLTRRIYIGPSP